MICTICNEAFRPEHQSAVCPHFKLEVPALPVGGVRLMAHDKAAIDEAYRYADTDTLWRFMVTHNNPAVRLYAGQLYDALKTVVG